MSNNMYNTYRQRNNSTGVRKHFHVEDYSGIYFTDELNAGEEFLYTTIGIKDDKEVTFLCKYVKNKHIEACPNCAFNNYFCHGLFM